MLGDRKLWLMVYHVVVWRALSTAEVENCYR